MLAGMGEGWNGHELASFPLHQIGTSGWPKEGEKQPKPAMDSVLGIAGGQHKCGKSTSGLFLGKYTYSYPCKECMSTKCVVLGSHGQWSK